MGADTFEWLQQYLEECDDQSTDEYGIPDDEREAYEDAIEAIGLADIFGEGFSGSDISGRLANVGKAIAHTIDVVIEKIKEVMVQFKLKYAKLHFKASMKKLGKSCLTQIRSAGVPKDYTSVVKAAMAIDQKSQSKLISLWMSYNQGKMDFDKYNDACSNVEHDVEAATDAIMLKFNGIIKNMSDDVVVRTETVLGQYDTALQSLVASEEAAATATIKHLDEIKKTAASKSAAFKQEIADRVASTKRQKAAKVVHDKVSNMRQAAANKVSSALAAVHSAISRLLSKIASVLARLGDKDLRHASGAKDNPDSDQQSKSKVKNEEVDDLSNIISDIFGEDGESAETENDCLTEEQELDAMFDKLMTEAAIADSGWDSVFGEIMESAEDCTENDILEESFEDSLNNILSDLDAAIA